MIRAWLDFTGESVDLEAEVARRAETLAAAAEKGARFLIVPTHDSREAAAWILACFHSPLTAVPLPPHLPAEALSRRLAQLPPGTLAHAGELRVGDSRTLPPRKAESELWAVIFTSGSSGVPKGVALSGSSLAASARAHAEHCGHAGATWLLDLPLYHVGGLSVLSRALFLGAGIALGAPTFDASVTAAWIRSGRVQGISLVPTTLFRLLKEPNLDFSALSLALVGGAPAAPALVEAAIQRGVPVRLTYGMTEHASQIATEKKPGAGLRALPGVKIQLGAEGEILVRSTCLARGIYQGGQLQPLPLTEGFFRTGDLGQWAEGCLEVRGRTSELIVSGGKKIFPVPVERALAALPGVRDAAVFPLPDQEWGEIVCAAIVLEAGARFEPAEAKASLSRTLEAHEVPKRWVMMPSIPRSGAGKILRAELRLLGSSSPQTQS